MEIKKMKPDWHLFVSFKSELLSEYLIHQGFRKDLQRLLPKIGLLRNRMNIDNDIYLDLREVTKVQSKFSEDSIGNAQLAYRVIQKQSGHLLAVATKLAKQTKFEDLVKTLPLFFNNLRATLGLIGIPPVIDLTLEDSIKEYLRLSGFKNIEKSFSQLVIPKKKVSTLQERVELTRITNLLERELNQPDQINTKLLPPRLHNMITRHVMKYGWIHSTLFLGKVYDENQVINEIKLMFGRSGEERKRLFNLDKIRQREFETVLKRIKNLKWKKEIGFFPTAIYFRTARLEWINQACYLARPALDRIARSLGLSFDQLIYLTPVEILNGLKGHRKVQMSQIKERQRGYALVSDDSSEVKLYLGRNLKALKRLHLKDYNRKEVKGITASKGVIRGRVVVVKDRSMLSKVKSGSILITPLTTPDFIIAMRKAGAIVTNLGGLTSHAAIVSRELGVPCIVGTGNATQVFKDGDLVEVDANMGVVRIMGK